MMKSSYLCRLIRLRHRLPRTECESVHYFNFSYDLDTYLFWFSNIAKRISFSFISLLNESHSGLKIFIIHSPIRVLFRFQKVYKQLILQQYSAEMYLIYIIPVPSTSLTFFVFHFNLDFYIFFRF